MSRSAAAAAVAAAAAATTTTTTTAAATATSLATTTSLSSVATTSKRTRTMAMTAVTETTLSMVHKHKSQMIEAIMKSMKLVGTAMATTPMKSREHKGNSNAMFFEAAQEETLRAGKSHQFVWEVEMFMMNGAVQ